MRYQNCSFGDKCKFFYPKKLKSATNHIKEDKTKKPFSSEEHPTYANIVRKSLEPQPQLNGHFLGITQPVHQGFSGQVNQLQQPYLGQANHSTQDLLEIQKNQKKMLELFMNLNQKVNNMYSLQM